MYKFCQIVRFAVNIRIMQEQEVLENYSIFYSEPMYVFKFRFYANMRETIHLKKESSKLVLG